MAAAVIKRLVDLALDGTQPGMVQIDAGRSVLPYLAPRLQVTASVSRSVGDFSDCKSVEELVLRVEQDLGEYWVTIFRKAVASGNPDDVIDAEIVSPDPGASQQPEPREPEPELAKP
jgi:hypothetical protein